MADTQESQQKTEDALNSSNPTPSPIPQAQGEAPQSVLDTISQQAVVEAEQEKNLPTHRFSLPKVQVESFFDHKHLKRKVKFMVIGYVIIVIIPLVYGLYTKWQENSELEVQRAQREQQYIIPLTSLDTN